MRVVAAFLSLLIASVSGAYSIQVDSIGAGGAASSSTEASIEIGATVFDENTSNAIHGYASASGNTGSMVGHMTVQILNFMAAQSSYLVEKKWKSAIVETIENLQIDPGATELVIRLRISATDVSDLVPAPIEGYDNGYARTHVRATLRYYNKNSHTQGLGEILGVATANRFLPADWISESGDVSPPGLGYGSVDSFGPSAQVELRIPASEVDSDDTLLVGGQLYGEVRGGHWQGAFASSELDNGGMSFEIVGGDGVPLNPIFLSAPEPGAALLGFAALATLTGIARRRA